MTNPRISPLILNVDDNDIGRYTVSHELRREDQPDRRQRQSTHEP